MKKNIILLFLTLGITTYGQGNKKNKKDGKGNTPATVRPFDSNFVHTVYFWLARPDNTGDRRAFEAALQKFLNTSAYARTKFIGRPPKAVREVVDDSFTYSLVVTFESAEAQRNYQEEVPHKRFIEEAGHLWTKVIVYDAQGM